MCSLRCRCGSTAGVAGESLSHHGNGQVALMPRGLPPYTFNLARPLVSQNQTKHDGGMDGGKMQMTVP